MASRDAENIENLIKRLSSESSSTTKRALAALTKLTRTSEHVNCLRLKGGMSVLLEFIRQPNQRHVDVALSALANCALDKDCRKEIRRLDGIRLLVKLLKVLHVTSILNRAARALANLAEDELNVSVMDSLGAVSELAKLLMEVTNTDCQETLLRALRKLCTTSPRKQTVLDLDCFRVIVELLKSEKTSVSNNCVRTLAEFTKNCSKELAQQVQEYDGIKGIVKLGSSQCSVVRHAAVLSLAHLAAHSHVRVCIGTEGGIQVLCSQLQASESGHVTSKAIEGLCYCCREAINRYRVRECGVLTSLLKLLSSGAYPHLHKKIVSAFTWFSYNEPCLEIMLSGGLVSSLVSYLSKVISDESGYEEHEEYFCDEINLSSTSDISSPVALPLTSSSMISDLKDAMTTEENSNETLEKLEDLAREIKGTSETSSRNFKRKLRMKSVQLCAQSPNVGLCCSASFSDVQSSSNSLPLAPKIDYPQLGSIFKMPHSPVLCDLQDLDTPQQVNISAASSVILPPCSTPLAATTLNSTCSSPPKESDLAFSCAKQNAQNSSPVMSKSDFVLYPWFRRHRSSGHCAMLLLSRISQMGDPSDILVTRPCIQVLLDYLTLVSEPSPKCARLLNCLTTNPYCFEAFVAKGIASQIHSQLCCGYRESKQYMADSSHACQVQGGVCAAAGLSNILDKKNAACLCTPAQEEKHASGLISQIQGRTCAVDFSSPSQQDRHTDSDALCPELSKEVLTASSCNQPENKSATDSHCQKEGISSFDTTTQVDQADLTENLKRSDVVQQETLPQNYCHKFGHQLLENLANQAQTPFGRGILFHLLLRGAQEERQACLLALPHICRNKRLQRQMLIQRKGVRMLCDLLKDSLTEEVLGTVVESLVVLADGLELLPCSPTIFSIEGDANLPGHMDTSELDVASHSDISGTSSQAMRTGDPAVKHFKVEPVSEVDNTTIVANIHSRRVAAAGCCYTDASAQEPFDIHFKMDSGDLICAHRDMLAATTDVFAAMLSGCYLEATQFEVTMPEIPSKVFTFALHCAYGCQMSVCTIMTTILKELGNGRETWDFLLEVLACADMFIFDKLKALCEKLLISLMESPCDAVSICITGKYFHSSFLCEVGLRYVLSRISSPLIRRQSFEKILSSNEKLSIVDQLCIILLSHLTDNI